MIHGLTMRSKLSLSGCLMRTKELPSGCKDRGDWGQEEPRDMTKVRIQIFLVSTFYTIFFTSLIFSSLKSIKRSLGI